MELNQLRVFAMAAEFENFTRVAEAMGVTQPAVSQQIAGLEQQLGVSLFSRRGRRIKLTEQGRHFYRYTRKALDLLDKAGRDLGQSTENVTGHLHIASCTIAAEALLPEVLAVFCQAYPHVRETLSVSNTTHVVRQIESGDADVGFAVVRPQGTRLRAKAIICEELMLVASPQHPLACREELTIADLRNAEFVLREAASGTRQCVEQALHEVGISSSELRISFETNSNEAIRGAVKKGSGIAFLPPASIHDGIELGRLVTLRVEDVHARLNIYLITDPQRVSTKVSRAFLGFVQ